MVENFDRIKQYVITLGGFEDSPKLDLQIEMMINEALAYCYREDVPPMMELPLADVIVNEFNKRELFGIDGDVSSYSEGDMSVTMSSSNSAIGKLRFGNKLEPFKQIVGATHVDTGNG